MMPMKRVMSVLFAAVVGVVCLVQADDMSDAKERRKARKDAVVVLVLTGKAEEGADGYLAAKAGLDAAQAALVKAENADRKIGYEAIAKANGKTVEAIGRQAAAINRANAAKK